MNDAKNIVGTIKIIRKEVGKFHGAAITKIGNETHSPFQVLVSCIMSLRTRDTVTYPTARKLFSVASTPKQIADMKLGRLEDIIRPVNYYKTKARRIRQISKEIVDKHCGKVPQSFDGLMKFRGVGRKTANIVLSNAYGINAGIAIDTHMKRVNFRLGLTESKNPGRIERDLMKIIPKSMWNRYTYLIIAHGRAVCRAPFPRCSICPLAKICPRDGVEKSF